MAKDPIRRIEEKIAEIKALDPQVESIIAEIAATRREYFGGNNSDELRERLEQLEKQGMAILEIQSLLRKEAQDILGIPDEILEQMEISALSGDQKNRIYRRELSSDEVAATNIIEEELPEALENILSIVDSS